MSRKSPTDGIGILFSRKAPAILGGILLFVVLVSLEGLQFSQWSATLWGDAPLVGGVVTTNEADNSGLKESTPIMDVAPYRAPLMMEDGRMLQGAKAKGESRPTARYGNDGLNAEVPSQPANEGAPLLSDTPDGSTVLPAAPEAQAPIAPTTAPQAGEVAAPVAPPSAPQPPAIQPPPAPTATTVPLPPPAPTEVPAPPPPPPAGDDGGGDDGNNNTGNPPPPPPPPPAPSGGDDNDDNGGDDDGDDGDGDDDGDDDGGDDDDGDDGDDGDDDGDDD